MRVFRPIFLLLTNLFWRSIAFISQLFELFSISLSLWHSLVVVILVTGTVIFCILGNIFYPLNIIGCVFSSVLIFYAVLQIVIFIRSRQEWQLFRFFGSLIIRIIFIIFAFSPLYFSLSNLGYGLNNTHCYNGISYFHCLYYSVTTSTTTGIGDFVPIHDFSRLITMFQIIFGPVFIISYVALYFSIDRRNT
ncbi:MAG: hypothetical protein KAW56_09145 [Candidatus Marinimicrobia bacterium]|nr:hypothetical protein [candidate division WOR-3 bacterium]MCK4447236.1 hypothetical protein [Candidatus Neomarinimicrobiota bacterium]